MLATKGNSNRFTQARASNYVAANRNVLLFIDNVSAFHNGLVIFANLARFE